MMRARAIVAGVAALIAGGGLIASGPALRRLAAVRADGARLAAIAQAPAAAPPMLMAPGVALRAGDAGHAAVALDATLRALAARERLLVEALAPGAGTASAPAIVVERLAVSGDARHVLRFAEAVESRTPAIRFARWRLERRGAALRLDADAALAWAPAP